jgi:cytochrome c oxidase subunit 2
MKTRIIVHTPEEYQSWLQSQQVATTAAPTQTVATKPADLPTSEFLAPYTEGMEIKSEALEQLRPVHHPAHHHTDLAEIQAVAAQLSPAT